jgi:hypothetical protein
MTFKLSVNETLTMPFDQAQCELLVNRIGEDEATRLLCRMLFSRIPGDALVAENEGLRILAEECDANGQIPIVNQQ